MRKISLALFATLAATMLAAPPAAAEDGDTKLYANLTGTSETPPNNAYATGIFSARVNPMAGQLCYKLTSQNLALLTMAHIHIGALGVAGPPVVTLMPDSPHETCMAIDKDVAEKLAETPQDYYVNIHTQTYPKGAIRGQLMK